MPMHTDKADAWYIGVVMACGFITFYAVPDAVPFLGNLTMMVVAQIIVGLALRNAGEELNYDP